MINFSKKNNQIAKCFYDHNEDVSECLAKLEEFFKILFSEECDRNKLELAKVSIDNCEHAADMELRHTVDSISSSLLPTTRTNLISLVQATDDIANRCQTIARQIYIEKINVPVELRNDILEIMTITRGQIALLYVAIEKLFNNFGGFAKDKKILDQIRVEESRVDRIELIILSRIFDLDIPLFEKVYYRDLILNICNLSDMIEDISDKIQVMLVEREV